uniref:Uncharacterized protein n=1 Tax=Aegilops tauschii subsp. strangulata TaxID=200361 RepID=A0A453HAM3_AEGTS
HPRRCRMLTPHATQRDWPGTERDRARHLRPIKKAAWAKRRIKATLLTAAASQLLLLCFASPSRKKEDGGRGRLPC